MQTLYGGAHSAVASVNGQKCNVCVAVCLITLDLLLCIHSRAAEALPLCDRSVLSRSEGDGRCLRKLEGA